MSASPRATAGQLVITAATRPINLGLAGVGVAAGLALLVTGMGAVPGIALLALSLVTWVGLTAWDTLFNPRLREEVIARAAASSPPKEETTAEVPLGDGTPPELRRAYEQVQRASQQIRQAMDGTGDLLQDHLVETWGHCTQLVDQAGKIAQRGNRLYAYLRSVNPNAVRQEIQDLQNRARRTRDEGAAAAYREAAQARQQQVEAWQQIEGLYERVKAEMVALQSRLDEVHARVIRLDASDLDGAVQAGQTMSSQLKSLNEEVTVLERAVAATLKEVSP